MDTTGLPLSESALPTMLNTTYLKTDSVILPILFSIRGLQTRIWKFVNKYLLELAVFWGWWVWYNKENMNGLDRPATPRVSPAHDAESPAGIFFSM